MTRPNLSGREEKKVRYDTLERGDELENDAAGRNKKAGGKDLEKKRLF
jgi:hypothetical protein